MDSYRTRRRLLADRLRAPLLMVASPTRVRSNDTEHEYRPDSDFFYLTGLDEPQAALLLLPGEPERMVLFVRPRDRERETWDGPRIGLDGALLHYAADESHPIAELRAALPRLLAGHDRLYFGFGVDPVWDTRLLEILLEARRARRSGAIAPDTLIDAADPIHEMRLRKDSADRARLLRAAEITCRAHRRAMAAVRPGLVEYELRAEVEAEFLRLGAVPGYPTIVGSGPNATMLHYIVNRRRIEEEDLIVLDAGAEIEIVTADVTRTFPANGRFSKPAAEIYELVLAAHAAAVAAAVVGASFDDPHQAALRVLVDGLCRLGVLPGDPTAAIEGGEYRKYYMHRTSHWLGLDVHDVGGYKRDGSWRRLEESMVLTIEPGLYFPPDDPSLGSNFRGLGVRIEDDIWISREGPEILTSGAPRSIAEIEGFMAAAAKGDVE